MVACSGSKACDFAGFHARAVADADRITNRHSIRAPHMEDAVACARGDREPGIGETEQVEAASSKFRSARNRYRREDGLMGGVLGQRPAGYIDASGARVVELDKRICRVGRST